MTWPPRPLTAALLLSLTHAALAQSDAQLRYACRDFVMRSLHDPDGAKLDWTEGTVSRRKDGMYVVQLTGRAKNAYNALRRATFECVIQHNGQDDFRAVSVRAR